MVKFCNASKLVAVNIVVVVVGIKMIEYFLYFKKENYENRRIPRLYTLSLF